MMPAPDPVCGLRKHPGGKDNFAADRAAAEEALLANPDGRISCRENRAFLQRAVQYLAAEAGIRQFLEFVFRSVNSKT